jgi:putative inorganic carbon (HCO3(-)) transporter
MSTGRVFATLFYPNAFAGALLLLLPCVLVWIWQLAERLRVASRLVICGVVAVAGFACFYWSGSKAGWLIMLGLLGAAAWQIPVAPKWRIVALGVMVAVGLGVFAFRYASFFQRGATSVVARGDYWRCAGQLFLQHPVLGTGPGTFQVNYALIKKPEAEMARLAHNDYLQQASDSGLVGALAYLAWIGVILRIGASVLSKGTITGAVALGLFGWFLQGIVEFGLYIPGLAWPGFLLAGGLLGQPGNAVDKFSSAR